MSKDCVAVSLTWSYPLHELSTIIRFPGLGAENKNDELPSDIPISDSESQ